MGRPRLYKTDNERTKAACSYRSKYNERNRDAINAKMRASYAQRREPKSVLLPAHTINANESVTAPPTGVLRHKPLVNQDSKHLSAGSTIAQSGESFDLPQVLNAVEACLMNLIKGSSRLFVESLVTTYMKSRKADYGYINQALEGAQSLEEQIQRAKIRLLHARQLPREDIQVGGTASRMAPKAWMSPERAQFLEDHHWNEKYRDCQGKKDYSQFWPPLFEAWFAEYPERQNIFPLIPSNIPLDDAQKESVSKAVEMRKQQLINSFRNRFGSSKDTRKAKNTAGVDVVIKSMVAIAPKPKGARVLNEEQAYSKLFYKDRIQQSVVEKFEELPSDLTRGQKLDIVKAVTKAKFEEEDEETKARVTDFIGQLKRQKAEELAKAVEAGETGEADYERAIENLPAVLSKFLDELARVTGWAFTVLMGGPNPSLGGQIDINSFHVGKTELGNLFNRSYPDFETRIMKPYSEFLERVYSADVFERGTNDIDREINSSSLYRMTPDILPALPSTSSLPALQPDTSDIRHPDVSQHQPRSSNVSRPIDTSQLRSSNVSHPVDTSQLHEPAPQLQPAFAWMNTQPNPYPPLPPSSPPPPSSPTSRWDPPYYGNQWSDGLLDSSISSPSQWGDSAPQDLAPSAASWNLSDSASDQWPMDSGNLGFAGNDNPMIPREYEVVGSLFDPNLDQYLASLASPTSLLNAGQPPCTQAFQQSVSTSTSQTSHTPALQQNAADAQQLPAPVPQQSVPSVQQLPAPVTQQNTSPVQQLPAPVAQQNTSPVQQPPMLNPPSSAKVADKKRTRPSAVAAAAQEPPTEDGPMERPVDENADETTQGNSRRSSRTRIPSKARDIANAIGASTVTKAKENIPPAPAGSKKRKGDAVEGKRNIIGYNPTVVVVSDRIRVLKIS
ncbi:hypothetical protein BJ138DRAFT_1230021 [Hygrophoropsis aurantiaca]|uniref:Uncharacterized protein n=1 Tax=Hygrophoropsis aurantiaca TaxID=72124 RepID=A0ACB7ZXI7_9AGAM|nr:hypothetical protein BJ138DRAFT_1230021 [Hygrophoropsis aurantiaca]